MCNGFRLALAAPGGSFPWTRTWCGPRLAVTMADRGRGLPKAPRSRGGSLAGSGQACSASCRQRLPVCLDQHEQDTERAGMPLPHLGAAITAAGRGQSTSPSTSRRPWARSPAPPACRWPGPTNAGISTIDRKREVHTRAATSELVWGRPLARDEGSCVDILRGAEAVVAARIRHGQRWPDFVPKAVQARSQGATGGEGSTWTVSAPSAD